MFYDAARSLDAPEELEQFFPPFAVRLDLLLLRTSARGERGDAGIEGGEVVPEMQPEGGKREYAPLRKAEFFPFFGVFFDVRAGILLV